MCARARFLQIGAALGLLLVSPARATAQGVDTLPTATASTPSGASGGPFSLSLTLESSVGLGSFVSNPDTGTMKMPYHALVLSVDAAYRLDDSIRVRAHVDIEKEITASYATATNERHQILPGDLWLALSDSKLFHDTRVTGIRVGGDLRVYTPTSYSSRYQGLLMGVSGALSLSRKLGRFELSLGSRYRRNLLRYTHPVIRDLSEGAGDPVAPGADWRPCIGVPVDGGMACGGAANAHTALRHSFGVGYELTPRLSASVSVHVINTFAYPQERDELSSVYATEENQRDYTWGLVDLSYEMTDWLSYSLGVSSYQPARTADGSSLRFPFWDTDARAENYTTVYVDLKGTL